MRIGQQLTSPFQDRHLSLKFPNALVGRGKLGLLGAVETRELTGVDQLLPAPAVPTWLNLVRTVAAVFEQSGAEVVG